MPYNQVYDVLNQTGKSMGEITIDRSRGDPRYRDDVYQDRNSHAMSQRSIDRERRLQERDRHSPGYIQYERESRSPTYRDRGSRSPTYRERESRSPIYVERESRSPIYGERESRSPIYGERKSRSPTYGKRESRSPTYRNGDRSSPTQRERGSRSPTQRERQSRSQTQRSTDYDRRTKSPRQTQEYYSNGFSPHGTRETFNSGIIFIYVKVFKRGTIGKLKVMYWVQYSKIVIHVPQNVFV
jgi:hypothetical protein